MIVLVDDEDRENEGDLVVPAQMATPHAINFMAKHGRGLICLALASERVRQLGLPLMAQHNLSRHQTAFTISIEAREGVTTGISAPDRARTIAVAIDPSKGRDDIVSPGHVFPLVAHDGGVLVRAGHTEAAADIARLAGLNPAGVICEIMNDDGTMARMPDLVAFAQLHGLKIGTIADLIAYRRRTERFVERVMDTPFESVHGGPFRLMLYRNTIEGAEHVALVKGKIEPGQPTLVRMHQVDFAADLLGHVAARRNYVPQALKVISEHSGAGVTVFLRDPDLHGLAERLAGVEKPKAVERAFRSYGVGAQILLDLGVRDMIVLSSSRPEPTALEGYGLRIVGWRDMDGEDQC
jgi:3,4-dihydroxy 2-butanone 4-phosphate synthase/GTP cyclohydrolase II